MVTLIEKMTDEIMAATLSEYENRKRLALKGYEERKVLLEKEKADKEDFVTLEKALAVKLEQIEKDKTKAVKKGWMQIGEAVSKGMKGWTAALEKMKQTTLDIYLGLSDAVGNFFTQIGNLSQTHYDNDLRALEKQTLAKREALTQEYEDERVAIENSTMSEDKKITALLALEQKKDAAIEKLEAETEKKKRMIQKKAFASQKKISLITAGINIAEAITKALSGGVPPWNIILAAITAAAGAIQIAAISSQSFPSLAEGGLIPRPMPVMAGHGPRGEIIASPEKLAEIISREIPRFGSPEMGLTPIQPIVNIYAQTLDRDTVRRAGEFILEEIKYQQGRGE